ncbi:MAG: cation:proton antiporter [Polyangiales bacterium]
MHAPHAFLTSLSVILCVAGVTTVVLQRLRQPAVLGYLLAGLLVGPHVPVPLATDARITAEVGELGVVLLMFSIGLEFSLRKLLRVGGTSALIAVLEVSAVGALGFGLARALGWTPAEARFAGAMAAISSSTIVAKVFREQRVEAALGDLVLGVLIVEDLIAILLLAVFTALSSGAEVSAALVGGTAARLLGFLAALLVAGMLVVPRLVRFVVALDRPETTLVASVGLCFAFALLARSLGYPVALGAFLAGSLVAESGQAHVVEHLVQPVRDLFAAVFFVAVGMQIDPAQVARHAGAVAAFTLVVVLGKAAGVGLGAFLGGHGVRRSLQAGMSLGQIGEFSFILVGTGASLGAVGPQLQPVAVAVSAVTTLLTPWLVRAAEPVARVVDRKLPKPLQTFAALYARWIEQLRTSSSARALAAWRVHARALALDVGGLVAVLVGAARLHDDAALRLQRSLALSEEGSRAVVAAGATLVAAPFLVGAIRVALRLGASLAEAVMPKAGASAIDLARAPRRALGAVLRFVLVALACAPVVVALGVVAPASVTAGIVSVAVVALLAALWARAADLQGHVTAVAQAVVDALAAQSHGDAKHPVAEAGVLAGLGEPVRVRLGAGDRAAGRSLAALDLRGRTGATVLAMRRGEGAWQVPGAHDALAAGDELLLAGATTAVEAARRVLAGEGDA